MLMFFTAVTCPIVPSGTVSRLEQRTEVPLLQRHLLKRFTDCLVPAWGLADCL